MSKKRTKRLLLIVMSVMVLFLAGISADAAFSVTKKNFSYPKSISAGTSYNIKGTVTSNEPMAKVVISILNSKKNKSLQKFTATPNTTTFNISAADNSIKFNKLAAGTYYFRVACYNAKGTKKVAHSSKLTVKKVKMKISKNKVSVPGSFPSGYDFKPSGMITSNLPMKSIVFTIYNSSGKKCLQRYTADVNATSYDVSKVASKLNFTKLAAGKYYYRISVYDMSNKKTRITNKKFTVTKAPAPTPTPAPLPTKITISNPKPAKEEVLRAGQSYPISGTINSANKLASVKAEIYLYGADETSKTLKYTKTVNPNATSYSLAGGSLDAAMKFESLPVGRYNFVVSATDTTSSKAAVLINRNFYVLAAQTKFWIDGNVIPGIDNNSNEYYILTKGRSLPLYGTLRSNLPISDIRAYLINMATGKCVDAAAWTPTPRTTLYPLSLSDIDKELNFEDIKESGNYTLQIFMQDTTNSYAPVYTRVIKIQ